MPLVDDLKMALSDEERSRRVFLGVLGGAAIAVAGLGTGVTAIRYLWPEVLFEEESRFRIGRPEDIAVGTVLVLPQQKAYVVRSASGFYALSATCTHLGCLTQYEQEHGRIFCPCHGSRFGLDGAVTNGPAPAPLRRLALAVESGQLVLDTAKPAEPDALLKV
jgi:nitrite reductase/ring-hydroxylating ferredoxin subunit